MTSNHSSQPCNRREQTGVLRRAISEYKEADNQFRLVRHLIFRADVSNNVGFLLFKLSRHKEAHRYLDQARRLTVRFKDKARTAQIDETRAQVFLAERKFSEAEAAARKAASTFAKAGHHCMMAEALITQGIALARLHRYERAQVIFQQAIKTAYQVNALNIAGLAALTLIEEIKELPTAILQAAYQQAREWLATAQSPDVKLRLGDAAGKFAASVYRELTSDEATEVLLTRPSDLQEKIIKYEGILIKQALVQANGSVTHAAVLLGTSRQTLSYIIESRHKDLLTVRTPIHRRPRKNQ